MTFDPRSHPGSNSKPQRYPGSFLLALREALLGLEWEGVRWLGDAVVCRDAAGKEQTIHLENLYQHVRRENRSLWPELIADFLNRPGTGEAQPGEVDLNVIADRLLIRVGTTFRHESSGAHVWSRPVGDTGLGINLVIDQNETMAYVTQETIAASGRPEAEWLARAVANLRQRTPSDCFETIHEESGLLACASGDCYDSSRALLLEELLEPPPAGLLFAVPSRDELLVLPVTFAALEQVHRLKVLAEHNHRQALHPISANVYWVHAGTWHLFPVNIRNNQVALRPPVEFFPMLHQLTPWGEVEGQFDFPSE